MSIGCRARTEHRRQRAGSDPATRVGLWQSADFEIAVECTDGSLGGWALMRAHSPLPVQAIPAVVPSAYMLNGLFGSIFPKQARNSPTRFTWAAVTRLDFAARFIDHSS